MRSTVFGLVLLAACTSSSDQESDSGVTSDSQQLVDDGNGTIDQAIDLGPIFGDLADDEEVTLSSADGALATYADEDYFQVDLQGGDTYEFWIEAKYLANPNYDPNESVSTQTGWKKYLPEQRMCDVHLTVFGQLDDTNSLVANDDAMYYMRGSDPQIFFTPSTSESYQIRVTTLGVADGEHSPSGGEDCVYTLKGRRRAVTEPTSDNGSPATLSSDEDYFVESHHSRGYFELIGTLDSIDDVDFYPVTISESLDKGFIAVSLYAFRDDLEVLPSVALYDSCFRMVSFTDEPVPVVTNGVSVDAGLLYQVRARQGQYYLAVGSALPTNLALDPRADNCDAMTENLFSTYGYADTFDVNNTSGGELIFDAAAYNTNLTDAIDEINSNNDLGIIVEDTRDLVSLFPTPPVGDSITNADIPIRYVGMIHAYDPSYAYSRDEQITPDNFCPGENGAADDSGDFAYPRPYTSVTYEEDSKVPITLEALSLRSAAQDLRDQGFDDVDIDDSLAKYSYVRIYGQLGGVLQNCRRDAEAASVTFVEATQFSDATYSLSDRHRVPLAHAGAASGHIGSADDFSDFYSVQITDGADYTIEVATKDFGSFLNGTATAPPYEVSLWYKDGLYWKFEELIGRENAAAGTTITKVLEAADVDPSADFLGVRIRITDGDDIAIGASNAYGGETFPQHRGYSYFMKITEDKEPGEATDG